jgi:hypothetical protein
MTPIAPGGDAAPDWLLGRWRLQRVEPGLEILPDTRMEFRADGKLLYTITVQGRHTLFELAYRIAGELLHTEHPTGGHTAAARFALQRDGLLEFDFDGRRAWFARERLM